MADTEHALHTFLAQVTSEMASEYRRIFAKTAEDPGTAGDEGEENWATLLREWLPPSYHVATKGRLLGADGQMSPQIDVLVLKPFYPPKLREKKVWLANGVAAAFECKTTLRVEHIAASAERCRAFKALFARRSGSPARELRSSLIYGILAHSHAWKAPASKPANNVDEALWQGMAQAAHPTDLVDLVCIADLGCWSEMAMPYYKAAWRPDATAHLESVFGGTWGPLSSMIKSTLAGDSQRETFQPIGGMLAYLTQRLGWNDPGIRELADYYRLANLWGQGVGQTRHWPKSILSDDVQRKIEAGHLINGGDWSEWSMALI
ncbi:MAG TPA: DUF6602 domain-containing protein [Allosphingosinicella sp.]|jgi:hypothetical protein